MNTVIFITETQLMAGETQTGNATIVFSIPGKDLSDNEIEKIREIPQSKP